MNMGQIVGSEIPLSVLRIFFFSLSFVVVVVCCYYCYCYYYLNYVDVMNVVLNVSAFVDVNIYHIDDLTTFNCTHLFHWAFHLIWCLSIFIWGGEWRSYPTHHSFCLSYLLHIENRFSSFSTSASSISVFLFASFSFIISIQILLFFYHSKVPFEFLRNEYVALNIRDRSIKCVQNKFFNKVSGHQYCIGLVKWRENLIQYTSFQNAAKIRVKK